VCTDCRIYYKCYGEFPCLEPARPLADSPDLGSNDEEVDFDDDDDVKPTALGGELNLTAIERDSDLGGDSTDLEDLVIIINTQAPIDKR
jgi:hypothetical protein